VPVHHLPRLLTALTILTILTIFASGCASTRPLRGGKALTSPNPAGGLAQTLTQSDNPAQPSRQTQHTLRTRTYTLEPGSAFPTLIAPIRPMRPISPISPISPITPSLHSSTTPASRFLLTDREETRAITELGAAQKDTGREFAAKLSSLKSTVWVGIALFLFGLASFAWPPLKLIIGSVTTSAAITAGGIVLIILPTLLVGHELLILAGVSLAVALWFLAHRHGHLRGLLTASSSS
jgi:hypothetical protein